MEIKDRSNKNAKIAFTILLVFIASSITVSSLLQSNFLTVDVSIVTIPDSDGNILVGKLYRRVDVTSDNPRPGVLALHGYNNDKDVQSAHSMELAKKGIVVLALDQTGHGDSGGTLNWGNLGNGALGGVAAYDWLASQPYVSTKMGIIGHSMGAFTASIVATFRPDHDALIYQAFSPSYLTAGVLSGTYHNVMQIWSTLEEFGGRTNEHTITDWIQIGLASIRTNTNIPDATYDTTYGSFADGTAQRYELLVDTHPGQTSNSKAVAAEVAWFCQTLLQYQFDPTEQIFNEMTYLWKDFTGLWAAIALILSVIPLSMMILNTPFFQEIAQPMPEFDDKKVHSSGLKWWIIGLLNAGIAAVCYVYFTHDTSTQATQPWFALGLFNNIAGFLVTSAGIAFVLYIGSWAVFYRKKEGNLYDLGVSFDKEKFRINKDYVTKIGKTILLTGILFGYMYLLTYLAETFLAVEFRGPWAILNLMTPERAAMFWIYLPITLAFWLMNGGIWLFGQARLKEESSELKTIIIWTVKILIATLTGLCLIFLIQYLPAMMGFSGITFNAAATPFSPMMPIQLMNGIPIFVLIYIVMIFMFRKTGKIYLGAFWASVLMTWMFVANTVVGPGL